MPLETLEQPVWQPPNPEDRLGLKPSKCPRHPGLALPQTGSPGQPQEVMPVRRDVAEGLCGAGHHSSLAGAGRTVTSDLGKGSSQCCSNRAGEGSVPRVTAEVSQAGGSPAAAEAAGPSSGQRRLRKGISITGLTREEREEQSRGMKGSCSRGHADGHKEKLLRRRVM